MAGIYIHIPFCKKACHYCNFHFSTSLAQARAMVTAINKEMQIRSGETSEKMETIYIGGGTPSLLDTADIEGLLHTAKTCFDVQPDAEITLEANPDDIHIERALAWKAMGINRFSIGIQSFSDQHLQWMNRAHDARQSLACIETIRLAGFSNFSIDLMYGTPGQSQEDWIQDLHTAINLRIPHLSCYAMTVEEGTALHHLIAKEKKEQVSEDEQAERFEALVALTAGSGYHHYEISNFALPGKESKHNSAYWEGKPYLGFGPSAHSFQGNKRSWNVANNAAYIQAIEAGKPDVGAEILSARDTLNEYIMTGLRSAKGISKTTILLRWGKTNFDILEAAISKMLQQGKIEEDATAWRLTPKGKFFADGIAASLFQV